MGISAVIEKIGGDKVKSLGLFQNGVALVGTQKSEAYQQYPISGGYWVMVHSSTRDKVRHLKTISQQLGLNLKIEVVEK